MMDNPQLRWRKSSRSQANSACVELAVAPAHMHVRDSKNASAGSINLPTQRWTQFLTMVQADQFGH